jgi:hypothetical protein
MGGWGAQVESNRVLSAQQFPTSSFYYPTANPYVDDDDVGESEIELLCVHTCQYNANLWKFSS